jgi:hypothetical protein
MTQGYLIMGVDDHSGIIDVERVSAPSKSTTNIERASALSKSIKLVDSEREVCVMVDKFSDVPEKFADDFDYVAELPYGRTDKNHNNIWQDIWQSYYCTPFDETMMIHPYSLVLDNIELLWLATENVDMAFATPCDFRYDFDTDIKNIQAQQRNNIEPLSAKVIYFKKEQRPAEFFKMADVIFREWRDIYRDYLPEYSPDDFDIDVMCSVVADMIGETFPKIESFDFTDLDIDILYDPESEENQDWHEQYAVWMTDTLKLKINNYGQTGVFHYEYADFMTPANLGKIDAHFSGTKDKRRT